MFLSYPGHMPCLIGGKHLAISVAVTIINVKSHRHAWAPFYLVCCYCMHLGLPNTGQGSLFLMLLPNVILNLVTGIVNSQQNSEWELIGPYDLTFDKHLNALFLNATPLKRHSEVKIIIRFRILWNSFFFHPIVQCLKI